MVTWEGLPESEERGSQIPRACQGHGRPQAGFLHPGQLHAALPAGRQSGQPNLSIHVS